MQQILADCGLHLVNYEAIYGGDISKTFRIHTDGSDYFLKVNDANAYPAMFEKEADGLRALRDHSGLIVPQVVRSGGVDGRQYLLLEWLERTNSRNETWEDFGRQLALMHQKPQSSFGWHTDNYIGSLQQTNTLHNIWTEFFVKCRVLPLVRRLADNGSFGKEDIKSAERLCAKHELFPEEPPSLLHGDLWSGNFMITADGRIAVYDPAVYCGHREMDIAMTMLFGGFEMRFYQAYEEAYPLSAGWRERLPLAQLYPILVHAVLFGGHYIAKARAIIQEYS